MEDVEAKELEDQGSPQTQESKLQVTRRRPLRITSSTLDVVVTDELVFFGTYYMTYYTYYTTYYMSHFE